MGAPVADGPDPNHGGPWKLKTNFGLTYEFVDTQNLLQWMSSRDELDGYMLSGGDDQFFPVKDFPQIAQGLSAGGRTRTSRPSNFSTGPIPPVNPGPNFGPVPTQGFGTAPPNLPGPRGDLIQNNNFQPPSRDAAWNKVLWVFQPDCFMFLAVLHPRKKSLSYLELQHNITAFTFLICAKRRRNFSIR